MKVYHGSSRIVKQPTLDYERFKLDFGKGFYVTTLPDQAEKWAARRAILDKNTPIVSVFEFEADNLNILYFDGYTADWLDFVVMNRAGTAEAHMYDAIYGNIANDDVASVVNDYMRLSERGRISPGGKRFFLEQLQYSKPNNQFCIASQKGIDVLRFIDNY